MKKTGESTIIPPMKFIRKNGLMIGIFPAAEVVAPQLELLTTTRTGGLSRGAFESLNLGSSTGDKDVERNIRLLLETLGKKRENIARANQVHGAEVATIEKGGTYEGVDALVTTEKNLTLVINTADCYPVIVYSPSERALAAIHAGSKGSYRGIIDNSIATLMRRFQIDLSNTLAFIGPGICKKCYSVDSKLASRFEGRYISKKKGVMNLDIEQFIFDKLISLGIKRYNVYRPGLCTSCNPELFYSYRRDRGVTGRHWTMATITEAW